MDLPRWQRQLTTSGGAGGALADPSMIAQPAEALRMMGDVLTEKGEQWASRLDTILANNQLGKFELATQKAIAEMQLGDDPRQYEQHFDETLNLIKAEHLAQVTHPAARRQAQLWLDGQAIDWRMGVKKSASDTVQAEAADVYAAARTLAKGQGNEQALTNATRRAIESGVFSQEVGELNLAADMLDIQAVSQKAAKEQAQKELEAQIVGMAQEGGWKKALDSVSDPANMKTIQESYGLTLEDTDKVIENLRTFSAIQEAAQKQQTDATQEADRLNILKLKTSADPADLQKAIETVNNSTLDAKEKETQLSDIQTRIKALQKGDTDPMSEYDPATYLELSRKVNNTPEKVTEGELAGYVGKGKNGGITTDQYETLRGRLEQKTKKAEEDPLKSRLSDRFHGAIDGLMTGKFFSGNRAETERIGAKAHNTLDAWILKNPDATAEDYEKFFNQILSAKDFQSGGLWRWMMPKRSEYFWAGGKAKVMEANLNALVNNVEYPEPKTLKEFEDTVTSIEDDAQAESYDKKWRSKF